MSESTSDPFDYNSLARRAAEITGETPDQLVRRLAIAGLIDIVSRHDGTVITLAPEDGADFLKIYEGREDEMSEEAKGAWDRAKARTLQQPKGGD